MEVVASGCAPWRVREDGKVEVLLILRNGGFWEFPKGKQEEGETDLETAQRELKEETGLLGKIDPERQVTLTYVYNRSKVRHEKVVHLFLCRVDDKAKVKVQRSEITDHTWLPLEDVVQRVTYPEGKEAARRICELLKDED